MAQFYPQFDSLGLINSCKKQLYIKCLFHVTGPGPDGCYLVPASEDVRAGPGAAHVPAGPPRPGRGRHRHHRARLQHLRQEVEHQGHTGHIHTFVKLRQKENLN